MVLQRDIRLPVWGSAAPKEKIKVILNGHARQTTADGSGKWRLFLPAMNAGGPFNMRVVGTQSIEISDVMIGEVWLCSGQSNMAMPLKQCAESAGAIEQSASDHIRIYRMEGQSNLGPGAFDESVIDEIVSGQFFNEAIWQKTSSETVADFSGVGYFFGKHLSDSLGITIGLIQNAVGGTPIQSWISRASLQLDEELNYFVSQEADQNWFGLSQINPWLIHRAKENLKITEIEGAKASGHPFAPGYMFRAGITPILSFGIRGVIWYQGESNATHPESYAPLFRLMVEDWRSHWAQNQFPFYFVQLPGIGTRSRWPEFRFAQEQCLSVPNTGMVVTTDLGDPMDVHPKRKAEIGYRLARMALAKSYGYEMIAEGPYLIAYNWDQMAKIITLQFSESSGKIMFLEGDEVTGLSLHGYHANGSKAIHLEASEVRKFDHEIVLNYPDSLLITTIKYNWVPMPVGNLVNEMGLPVRPFKIELVGNE